MDKQVHVRVSAAAEVILRCAGNEGSWHVWNDAFRFLHPLFTLGEICGARRELLGLKLIAEDWIPDDTDKEPVFVFRSRGKVGH